MNKYILLTVSMFFQVVCLHADTFTIRPVEPQDMPTCIQIAKQVSDTVNRPFLSINGAYSATMIDDYIRKLDETFFDDFGTHKIGQLFVAENESKQIIACMKVDPFFVAEQNSETWKQFVTIKFQEIIHDTLENDITWFIKHCDGSGIYVSRLYVDQNWRGKGIGKLLLKSLKGLFPQAKKIYLDSYVGNKLACGFYKHLGFTELDHLSIGQFNESVFFSIDINLLDAVTYQNTQEFAQSMDGQDPVKNYRSRFYMPKHKERDILYFTGNSLGLQPKQVSQNIQQELEDWATHGVEGHWNARNPWLSYHEILTDKIAKLVGANPIEVVMMNGLSVNLHLLLASFYRPTETRYKILCEQKAFPSDQYVLESQIRFHGYNPDDAIIEVGPRDGELLIRNEDIIAAIEQNKDQLALVMIGGVNYATGQLFDMQAITKAGHEAGAIVGFDLAHAVGNVQLDLHTWDVDFAAWCSYKYLNSGPGGVAGIFVHERYAHQDTLRFAGWWGHDKATRFNMNKGFKAIPGAQGWQLSNAPVFSMAACKASLDIFDEVGMQALCAKSKLLTGYLEFIIQEINKKYNNCLEIITPQDPAQRGCQLSVIAHGYGKKLCDQLADNGVIVDWREPNIIRVAPVPLYNTYEDVYRFGQVLEEIFFDNKKI